CGRAARRSARAPCSTLCARLPVRRRATARPDPGVTVPRIPFRAAPPPPRPGRGARLGRARASPGGRARAGARGTPSHPPPRRRETRRRAGCGRRRPEGSPAQAASIAWGTILLSFLAIACVLDLTL